MEKPRAGHVRPLQGGNPRPGIYGGLCPHPALRGHLPPRGEGKGGKEVPMPKIYFHVDVNSAFLSWSALKALQGGSTVDLRTIPAVVGGDEAKRHGVVLAKSTPAKKFGIQTGESLFAARVKCPGLTVVPPDFDFYVKILLNITHSFS